MKIKGLRWWVLTLIVIVTIINYLDRNTLGIMWQDIVRDLNLVDPNLPEDEFKAMSKTLFTAINIIFMVAYGFSQFFSGRIYDKIGNRKGFTLSVLVWGISDALTSFAVGVKSVGFFRAILGLGVAGPWPGVVKSNAEWFPQKERSIAQGLFNVGASVGAILAPILIGIIWGWAGWKMTFVIFGSLGLFWLIPWLIVNKKSPAEHPWITDEEKQLIEQGKPACKNGTEKVLSYKEILSNRRSWGVILGRFFMDPIWWMFVANLPLYLYDVYGFNVKDIGMTAWVPYVGAAFGSFAGGWVSSWLLHKGMSVNASRKISILIGGAIVLPTLVAVAFISKPIAAVVAMAVILFGFQFAMNNIQTIPSDVFSGKSVGSLAGLGGAAAALGTIASMLFIPMLTAGSNWTPLFVMGACLVPLSLISVCLIGGKIEHQS